MKNKRQGGEEGSSQGMFYRWSGNHNGWRKVDFFLSQLPPISGLRLPAPYFAISTIQLHDFVVFEFPHTIIYLKIPK